jgi:hypothetical protein
MPIAAEPARLESLLRPPDKVMRLDRMGSAHQTRLSFLRVLLRRMAAERWQISRPRFDIDARGVGTAVYSANTGERTYSLVAFGHDLAPEKRTDRVIAEEWDATFVLYDGVPSEDDIARLSANVPRQEAGRYLPSELVLARANRSVRLFDHVVDALARGAQPDAAACEATGYLMRTTAVYGNGKFGIADRDLIQDRRELAGPFQAEMLTVYLIRVFTVDLVEQMARLRAPGSAVPIAPALRRRLGVGNATGLGMAPFLVRHPALVHRWIAARETALARVRSLASAGAPERGRFRAALASGRRLVAHWVTEDAVQAPRIVTLSADLEKLERYIDSGAVFELPRPWDAIYRLAERELSLEGQEFTVTLLLEPHGSVIDDLAAEMAVDESREFLIDGITRCGDLMASLERDYRWALGRDFGRAQETALFWYVSEEKLEPRLGTRAAEPGAELELPLAVARDVASLHGALAAQDPDLRVGEFLMREPEHRHAVRRVQRLSRYPYAEIRDNLIGAGLRAVDILRCKLAFFGVTRFDPRSDKWLRITLFQGAPFPHELAERDWDDWIWPAA